VSPKTDEDAESIVDEVEWAAMDAKDQEYQEWLRRQQAVQKRIKAEAGSILDGAPPNLPPPTTPPEPQKLGADTDWAETKSFVDAVKELLELRAKPVARFVGMFSPAELREVGDFLMAVAAADKEEAA